MICPFNLIGRSWSRAGSRAISGYASVSVSRSGYWLASSSMRSWSGSGAWYLFVSKTSLVKQKITT